MVLAFLVASVFVLLRLHVEKIAYKPLRGASRLSPLITPSAMSIFSRITSCGRPPTSPLPEPLPELPFMSLTRYHGSTEFIMSPPGGRHDPADVSQVHEDASHAGHRAGPDMAMLVGVNVNRVISTTFIIAPPWRRRRRPHRLPHRRINFSSASSPHQAFTAAFSAGSGASPARSSVPSSSGGPELRTGYVSAFYEDVSPLHPV